MAENKTEVERITLVLHPIWIYYRQRISQLIVPQSIQDNLANGDAQQMLDTFPHLTRAEAGFLGLTMNIILGEEPFDYRKDELENVCEGVRKKNSEGEKAVPKWFIELIQKQAENCLRKFVSSPDAKPGFCKKLRRRVLDVFDKSTKGQ